MTDTTCAMFGCDREPGTQDRDDYRKHRFCSVQCDVKHEKHASEATEARRDAERLATEEPRDDSRGW